MRIDNKKINTPALIAALVLVISFFPGWVKWNTTSITGIDLPNGSFFKTAETKFGLPNPFPQFNFLFNLFWLIPAGALVTAVLSFLKKNNFWPSVIAGALSLSATIVYYLFSKQLVELGHSFSIQPWLYIHAAAAIAIILLADGSKWLLKIAIVLLTVIGTYFGFKIMAKQGEKKILEQTFEKTSGVKADYTIDANTLIKEFLANDSAARNKYNEKTLEVSGAVKEVKLNADSTSTLQFADSTGSYAIFSFEKTDIEKVKNIKAGDTVKVKGVCSGSMYSEIFSNTTINFKRSILNQ